MTATDMSKAQGPGGSQKLALLVVALLAVMVVPVPPMALDLLLCANISLSLIVLMAVLGARRASDFSTFPSVLLFTALARLALNVASTRLILLTGDPGNVIKTFGDFVVGGDFIVGIIVFLILVVIQFVVITKGQNRISEVAARFTLDAMPGKQMAIDADLSAGIISSEEARARRQALSQEAEFYGAMDGAGKFVRGDAIAGLIITAINIVGGLIVGTMSRGLDLSAAFATYTILTVGDGLVTQIPSIVVSTASGLLVTKTTSDESLGKEMSEQLLARGGAMRAVGGVLIALAVLPGMPTVVLLCLAGGLILGAGRIAERIAEEEEAEEEEPASPEEAPVEEMLAVDRLSIEIGFRLIGMVDESTNGGLLDHIRAVRRQFASSLGILVPPIRVRDNVQLEPNQLSRALARPGSRLGIAARGTLLGDGSERHRRTDRRRRRRSNRRSA